MTARRVRLSPDADELRAGFERIRRQMDLPRRFPEEVLAEVRDLPEATVGDDRVDATDIEFLTIDPQGSRDLDQALHAERDDSGYEVHYAIADVAFFVRPGSALDRESRLRGQTLYCPDQRVLLYPAELSEGAASLLAGMVRPAVLWTLRLDEAGRARDVGVTRALIKSDRQLTYTEAQERIDRGQGPASLDLLKEIGELRQHLERERGAISLHVPEQEVIKFGSSFRLSYRAPLAVEDWNAQISLMTGMAGAEIMLRGKIGLLRTMPPPSAEAIAILRRSAKALGLQWSESMSYADFVNTLDAHDPADAAIVTQATRLFRGVTYLAFDGSPPGDAEHHAIAAPYAHVTAPLRRMADRYATEVVLSLDSSKTPPKWCVDALPELPDEMKEADRRDGELERRIVDFVEAAVLADRKGEVFDAVVVEVGRKGGTIQVADPAVLAQCHGDSLLLGATVRVRLAEVDPEAGSLSFEVVGPG